MNKHQILVVESNSDMQNLYRAIFRRHEDEFSYHLVQSGEVALKFLEHTPIDLLLLSWNMPRIPAIDVLQLVRARLATQNLPVVVVADAEDPEERLEVLRHGADHYQAKGFNVEEFLARIRQLLRRGTPAPRNFLANLLMCFPI